MIMVVGIPQQPLEFNGLDIALGRYQIKGSSNGSKQARYSIKATELTNL
jgi:hypothetical protein